MPLLQMLDLRRCLGTSGSGRRALTRHTRASASHLAHSANTTASSCATNTSYAAAPARLPGRTFDRPIVISSHPKRDGSSAAFAWPKTHERHLTARPFARADCFTGGSVTRTPQSTKGTALQAVLR